VIIRFFQNLAPGVEGEEHLFVYLKLAHAPVYRTLDGLLWSITNTLLIRVRCWSKSQKLGPHGIPSMCDVIAGMQSLKIYRESIGQNETHGKFIRKW